ncbi:MAG TPA: tripartite tricarboxylate transporter substrate-binding protein, partial [Acetobacteraceae bacterium]|nr:tripartite tricarboxylate transporter substrate-binding protein [Acetobacteraceae bacterium]
MSRFPTPLRRRRALAIPLLAVPGLASAQGAVGTWPSRPIRIIVAWPPGGGADTPVRLAAPAMQAVLGQTIVIENRAGASGSVGSGVVAQAAPDGYTVGADTAGISVNHLLIPGLPYDAA